MSVHKAIEPQAVVHHCIRLSSSISIQFIILLFVPFFSYNSYHFIVVLLAECPTKFLQTFPRVSPFTISTKPIYGGLIQWNPDFLILILTIFPI